MGLGCIEWKATLLSRALSGALLVIASAIGFSVMPIFALYAYADGINTGTLLFYRFGLASLLLFVMLLLSKNRYWPNRSQVGALFLLGGVFYALQSTCYFVSVRYISPGLAALILYTYPVFVAILAVPFNGEKLTSRVIVSLVVSLLGVTLILGSVGSTINPIGLGLALAAAVVYSLYIVIGNRLTGQLPALVTTAFVTLFASLSFLVTGVVTGSLNLKLPTSAWPEVSGLILIATVFAIMAFFSGMERVGSTQAAILSTTEPLATAILSALVLHQLLTPFQAVGGVAVLCGAFLAVMPGRKVASSSTCGIE
jgi:drug/metabolite transporter (DMT)-like permease